MWFNFCKRLFWILYLRSWSCYLNQVKILFYLLNIHNFVAWTDVKPNVLQSLRHQSQTGFLESKINWSVSFPFKICFLFCYIRDISVLGWVWIWKIPSFSKIAFWVFIYSIFVLIKDLNLHNKDLIDYVNFGEIWSEPNTSRLI